MKHFVHRPRCDLCGAETQEILISIEFTDPRVWRFLQAYYEGRIDKSVVTGARLEVARCRACAFAWQTYVLDEATMGLLYGTWISAEHSLDKKRYAAAALFRKYAREATAITAFSPRKPHEIEVLDFGMGWGYWCRMAQAFGYRARGFDVVPDRLDHARAMGITAFDSFQEVLRHRFDFINAEMVFEHIKDPLGTLAALGGALRAGGVIRVSVPDSTALLQSLSRPDWRAGKDAAHPLEHINCFTHETLKTLGAGAGLTLAETPSAKVPRTLRSRLRAIIPRRRDARKTALYFSKGTTSLE